MKDRLVPLLLIDSCPPTRKEAGKNQHLKESPGRTIRSGTTHLLLYDVHQYVLRRRGQAERTGLSGVYSRDHRPDCKQGEHCSGGEAAEGMPFGLPVVSPGNPQRRKPRWKKSWSGSNDCTEKANRIWGSGSRHGPAKENVRFFEGKPSDGTIVGGRRKSMAETVRGREPARPKDWKSSSGRS